MFMLDLVVPACHKYSQEHVLTNTVIVLHGGGRAQPRGQEGTKRSEEDRISDNGSEQLAPVPTSGVLMKGILEQKILR